MNGKILKVERSRPQGYKKEEIRNVIKWSKRSNNIFLLFISRTDRFWDMRHKLWCLLINMWRSHGCGPAACGVALLQNKNTNTAAGRSMISFLIVSRPQFIITSEQQRHKHADKQQLFDEISLEQTHSANWWHHSLKWHVNDIQTLHRNMFRLRRNKCPVFLSGRHFRELWTFRLSDLSESSFILSPVPEATPAHQQSSFILPQACSQSQNTLTKEIFLEHCKNPLNFLAEVGNIWKSS